MNKEVSEFRPDMIERFCSGTWFAPELKDKQPPVRPWLLSVYGSALFAAAATALVRFLGSG